jgi:diguanylate cyclase (GGDEF)-like protein
MATMGILFIIMMLLVVSRMHATLVAAFRFDIQNAQLARDTLRLNQELQVANDKFKRLSFYDSLTNATNRRFITDVLQNEVNRFTFTRRRGLIEQIIPPDPQKLVYGLFIVDIDHFKQINDTYGHHYGDRMLIQFVDILKSLVRKDDVVSRWGGEEFVIVLKRTAPEYLQVFAKKVIQAIAATEFKVSETETIRKTCSLGFTELPFFRTVPDALTLEQTLEIADHALYHAKSSGRNQAIMAVNKLASEDVLSAEKGAMLVKNLSDAIEKGLLQLVRVN